MNLKDLASKIWNFGEPKHSHLLENVGWHSVSGSTMDFFHQNNYENGYPSIRVLSQRFAEIEPYTVDKNANSVASNVLDRLYTPNNQMSAYDFREALAVMSLVHNKVYIRVHHRGTRINAESITGFTFLEFVTEHIVDGRLEYWLPSGEKIGTDEVIVLRSINPYDLNAGFSPAYAARRWTSLDDLIADYQTGFFNNGAVPSGQFTITAKTAADFKDIVSNIKERHQGSGNNGGVMYAHRPVSLDGKPMDSQIEWTPFSVENKDMALKDIFEQANKKIDSAYGVPASMRGVNDSNTYASIRVDEMILYRNALNPFTLKIWQKFTHELNRITGGIGVAITYTLEPPVIVDEEKVKAEAKNIDAQTVTQLTLAGYTLDSAIAYVETGDIKSLKQLPKKEEKPEVLDSDEANDTPDQPVDPSRRSEKDKHPKAKALSPDDRADYEGQLEEAVRARMAAQIEVAEALTSSKAVTPENPVEEAEDTRLADAMLVILLGLVAYQGDLEHRTNLALVLEAGINTEPVTRFRMTGAQEAAYRAYVEKVARSYNAQTAERIRNILAVGREQGLSASEMKKQMRGLLDEDWRIKRLSTTEINKAGNEASLFSMENIVKDTGADVVKVWAHSGGDAPCEFCRAYIGTEVPLRESFVAMNEQVVGAEGGIRINDFEPIEVGGMHANCHCRQTYRVIGRAA